MKKKDKKELKNKIDVLLKDLTYRLENEIGDNLLSFALAGSTLHDDLKSNQDVDLVIILNTIKNENLDNIEKTLNKFSKGGIDLPYSPNTPKIKKIFEGIKNEYTSEDTSVQYKFTLGNYWGHPVKGKKYTIHLHVIGPHSIESFNLRLQKFHKVILSNIIHNSKTLSGINLVEYFKTDISKREIIDTLKMLQVRQQKAFSVKEDDLSLALTISIKNIAKIAMVALEYKGIFVNQNDKSGKLFKKHFKVPNNNLPEKVNYLKRNKDRILLEDKRFVEEIIQKTKNLLFAILEEIRG